jgi:Spirocyclase AveC-like
MAAPTDLEQPLAPASGSGRSDGRTDDRYGDRSIGVSIALALVCCLAITAIVLVAHNAGVGVNNARIANSAVHGTPRPVRPLFGRTNWLTQMQIGTIVQVAIIFIVCFVAWRRYPKHPYVLMTIACTTLIWQDPIMNWAPYAVYNPQLWHWPVTWPLVSMSPTVEPFVVIGYAGFYFLPFFPAIWILRRLQRGRSVESFVWKHPLLSLAGLILVIGFIFDAMLEIFCVRAGLYIYSQVIPFGSVFTGKAYQFPLLWESTLVTTVMIPAGVLVYRDDTGRTVAEKLAQRVPGFRTRPALGSFLVMVVILNGAYFFLYGGSYALIRASGQATSVACPYPYPEAKVYDPQGYYQKAGQPGPYYPGIWSGWESGQSGRPTTVTPDADQRCAPGG